MRFLAYAWLTNSTRYGKRISRAFRTGSGQGAASRGPRWFRGASDALCVGITNKKVNWVLDLDIKSFFDKIEHEWLVKFVEHRIAD